MSEYLGGLYILIGIASLALAILIPTRAINTTPGFMLCAFLVFNALERFNAGHNRLVGITETPDGPSLRVMIWATGSLIALLVLIVYAWRSPEIVTKRKKTPDD